VDEQDKKDVAEAIRRHNERAELNLYKVPMERRVFSHCNVCGIPIHKFEEEQMGMCLSCAGE